MDNAENQISAQSEVSELRAQYDSLHHLVASILVLLIVVSGTLWIYLLRQVKSTKSELEAIRPQAMNIITQYQKTTGPATDEFVRRLMEFGRTHPDFVPVLTKYGIKPAGAPGAVPAPMAPVPAPTAKK
jgi:hypothetical protein